MESKVQGRLGPIARLWISCWIELLYLLPILLLLEVYVLSGHISRWWWIGVVFLPLAGAALSARIRPVWARSLTSLLFGVVYAIPISGGDARAVLLAALGTFFMLQGMTASSRQGNTIRYWIGVAVYFGAAVAYPLLPALEGALPLLTAAGALGTVIAVYAVNRRLLAAATLSPEGGQAVPSVMKGHNRIYIGLVLLAAIGAAALAGSYAGRLLWSALRWLLGLLLQNSPQETQSPRAEPQAPDPSLALPKGEPGMLAVILDMLFYVVGGAALVLGVAWALRWLYRHGGGVLHSYVRRIAAFLRRTTPVAEEKGYSDEETGVFKWEQLARRWQAAWSSGFGSRREERWEDQGSNRDRVRYLYRERLRSAVKQGYVVKEHYTPRETETDLLRWEASHKGGSKAEEPDGLHRLLRLYYKVRYGGQEATDEELLRIKRK